MTKQKIKKEIILLEIVNQGKILRVQVKQKVKFKIKKNNDNKNNNFYYLLFIKIVYLIILKFKQK